MEKTPKYVRQIEVGALSIKSIKASEKDGSAVLSFNEVKETKKVSKEWVEKNNPQVDGYLVIYEDGDDSFSSKESFEGRYKKDEVVEGISGEQESAVPTPRELDPLNRPMYKLIEGHAAIKIKAIEENADGTADITPEEENVDIFTVNQAFMHNQQPKVGGYFVVTQANMQMYVPAETFTERYK